MKNLVLTIAMVVGVTAFAQERRMEKRAMPVENKVKRLTQELDLTQEQQEKLKVLYEKKRETRQKERAERMDIKRSENQEFDNELRSILTPEQAKKFEMRREEMRREEMRRGKGEVRERGEMIQKKKEKKLKKSK